MSEKRDFEPKRFVGLHAHSCIGSPFDALGYPEEHQAYAIENGMDALALTDHGNMNGYAHAHQNYLKLKKAGVNFKFLPGCEFYYHPDLAQWKQDHADACVNRQAVRDAKKRMTATEAEALNDIDNDNANEGTVVENEAVTKDIAKSFNPVNRRHHLVALAKSTKGLENLFAMVSHGYKDGFYKFPRIDRKLIKKYGKDIIISTACVAGVLSYDVFFELKDFPRDRLTWEILDDPALMERVLNRMENTCDELIDAVGPENFFAEIQFNKLPSQHLANRAIMALAKKNDLQLIATADSHYCRPDYWQARELYKAIGRIKHGDIDPSMIPKSVDELKCELYPKNAQQMWAEYKTRTVGMSFYDDDLVSGAIERTWDVAHNFIATTEPDVSTKLPDYVIPKGKTATVALVEAVKEGLKKKGLDKDPKYIQRALYEMSVIKDRKFEKYFLLMKKIFDVASAKVLVGPGRGSAAGSLVNYVLGITQLDPLKYPDLVFERFITKQRIEVPDIDCLASHHLVMMGDQTTLKKISDIVPGDVVIDMYNSCATVTAAQKRMSTSRDVIMQILVRIGDTLGTIVCNHKHRLFVPSKKPADNFMEPILAKHIVPGDVLMSHCGTCVVLNVKTLIGDVELVDISVKNSQSFCVIPFDVLKIDTSNIQLHDESVVCVNTYIDGDLKDVLQEIGII